MAVLFALLVVAVVGAAVVIALKSPQTGQVSDPAADRELTEVSDRDLTAADLREVEFPVVLRGYRMEDVDALLDRLSVQLDSILPVSNPEESPHEAPPT